MSETRVADPFSVRLAFHGDLRSFLKRSASDGVVIRTVREKTSVKDVIESCGVPHTEVDLIFCDGAERGFEFHLAADVAVDVYSTSAPLDLDPAIRLQRRGMTRFVVDGHLGKLARNLRLLGFDTVYHNDADDAWLVRVAVEEARALLTRDRRLLMHAVVRDGYCPRSVEVASQLAEVIARFAIVDAVRPCTRCLRCNGILVAVDKSAVLEQLEPLTRIYYHDFRRCSDCMRVYWPGSHSGKLQARIDAVRVPTPGRESARSE